MTGWEPYRVFTSLDGLREALVDRIEDLNISRGTVDEAAGLAPGYAGKLLCDPPMKQLANGTIPKMLAATGMVLVAVIDDERFAEVKAGLMARKHNVRRVGRLIRIKGHFTKENAGKYSEMRWADVSPEMRRKTARKARKAGWKKVPIEMRKEMMRKCWEGRAKAVARRRELTACAQPAATA